jgi:hypothetical protein
MGFWSKLGKVGLIAGAGAATAFTGGAAAPLLGAAIANAAKGSATNRGEKFEGQTTLEQLMLMREQQQQQQQIAREAEGRAGSSDAWRKLISTSRTLQPGARPQLSPYSIAPRQASEAEMQGAGGLQAEVLARLQGGNPIPQVNQHPLAIDPKLLDAGKWEQILGLVGAGLSAYGGWKKSQRDEDEA